MTPMPRGTVPLEPGRRLKRARRAKEAAEREFREAVVAARQAGGSIREVAELAAISTRTVQDWASEPR